MIADLSVEFVLTDGKVMDYLEEKVPQMSAEVLNINVSEGEHATL